jgi:glycosyltransferase involved in cell wall biosynthesis
MGLRKKVRAMLGLPKRARKPHKTKINVSEVLEARTKLLHALSRLPAPDIAVGASDQLNIQYNPGQPFITVAIPLYNEPRFIVDAIKSVKRQTFRDFEAIIVDDASTDNSRAVAHKAISDDPRFRIVQHLKNSGGGAARNTALRLARTPLITFLDADDILMADSLELRINAFLESANDYVAGTFSGICHGPEDTKYNFVPKNRNYSKPTQTFISAEGECPFNIHAVVARTDILRRLGGFDEALRNNAEDWELWQRILRHGYIFTSIPIVTAVYRARPGSIVRSEPLEHTKAGRRILNQAYDELADAEIISGTPFVFNKGWGRYRRDLLFLARVLNFGAMAFMNSRHEFDEFLKEFPAEIWPYAKLQIGPNKRIRDGIVRYLAASVETVNELESTIDSVADVVMAHFEKASQDARKKNSKQLNTSSKETALLFASGIHQAKIMADLAGQLNQLDVEPILVGTEALSGDQGVEAYWSSRGIPFKTFNWLAFSGWRFCKCVQVVMRPYSGYVRNVLENNTVVEIIDPYGENDLPEANGPASPDSLVSVEEAAAAILRLLEITPVRNSALDYKDQPAGIIVNLEESVLQRPDYDKIAAFKDRYKGERCFIIGNGPSINNTDLRKLKNEFTFAVNGIFYKKEDMGFDPTFYVVTDSAVMKENTEAIKAYKSEFKFFPTLYRSRHPEEAHVQFFLLNRGYYERSGQNFCVPRFSFDPARRIFCGQSVTLTNIQLAYYMGFREVYLIGMDFNYVIPASAIVKGELITSTEEDPNHFHPMYFGPGKTWKDPHLNRIQIGYQYARDIFKADNREIINATKGGKLEVFRRVEYDSLFG